MKKGRERFSNLRSRDFVKLNEENFRKSKQCKRLYKQRIV